MELTDRYKHPTKPRKNINVFDKSYYYQNSCFLNYVPAFLYIYRFTQSVNIDNGNSKRRKYDINIIACLQILKWIWYHYNNGVITNSDLILVRGLGLDTRSLSHKLWKRINKDVELPTQVHELYSYFFDERHSKKDRLIAINHNSFDKQLQYLKPEDMLEKTKGLLQEMGKFDDDVKYRLSFSKTLGKEIGEFFEIVKTGLDNFYQKNITKNNLKKIQGCEYEKSILKIYMRKKEYLNCLGLLLQLFPDLMDQIFYVNLEKPKSVWQSLKKRLVSN